MLADSEGPDQTARKTRMILDPLSAYTRKHEDMFSHGAAKLMKYVEICRN